MLILSWSSTRTLIITRVGVHFEQNFQKHLKISEIVVTFDKFLRFLPPIGLSPTRELTNIAELS